MSVFLLAFLVPANLAMAMGQEPGQESPAQDIPLQNAPGQDAPAQESLAQEAPVQSNGSAGRVTVQGTVRNRITGEPLPRALVQIEGDADTGTLTDGEGRFEIPGVPVGAQTIRVVKPGFRDRPYPIEEGGLQAEGPAHSVLVAAQMPELDFALTPNGAIHGRIELSTGDPATGMNVIALKRLVRFGHGVWAVESTAPINGEGAYRFGGLPDGVYIIQTQPALESEPATSVVAPGSGIHVARNGFASVYYPDARDFASAARIRLSGGSQVEANFSLSLEPFYPVTATAAGAGNMSALGRSVQQIPFTGGVMDNSGENLPYLAQYDGATHSLQASLPNGAYSLVIHGTPPINSFQPADLAVPVAGGSSREVAGATEFAVAGHAVSGLRIPVGVQQPALIHLRIVHNADGPNEVAELAYGRAGQVVNLNIEQASGPPPTSTENVLSTGNQGDAISFAAQPGSYWISVNIAQRGWCAGPLTAGGANLAREPLTLNLASTPPPMELTLRDDCGSLALTLPGALSTFLPGEEPFYTVYVVPDFDTVQDTPPMTVHASSGPTLTIGDLTPGSYHVYAFDTPVHLEYRNPAVLAALPNAGQQVTVGAGSTANVVLEGLEH